MLLKVLLFATAGTAVLLLATADTASALDVNPVVPVLHTWQRSLAGAGAFAAATILTSPMDVVKTRAQASTDNNDTSLTIALDMLRQEGVLSFFSGLAPALLMAPAAMVQYTVIDPLRARFGVWVAAMIAGALSVTIKCPFDRLKTLLQNDLSERTARELFLLTLRDSGVTGLWTGYGATLARDMPYHLLKWGVYIQAQAFFRVMMTPVGMSPLAQNLLAGAAAGAISATVVTPFDVIKTRLQVGGGGGVENARKIVEEEGVKGLFRGLGLRLARIPFYTSITLATFDGIKDAFISANANSILLKTV